MDHTTPSSGLHPVVSRIWETLVRKLPVEASTVPGTWLVDRLSRPSANMDSSGRLRAAWLTWVGSGISAPQPASTIRTRLPAWPRQATEIRLFSGRQPEVFNYCPHSAEAARCASELTIRARSLATRRRLRGVRIPTYGVNRAA